MRFLVCILVFATGCQTMRPKVLIWERTPPEIETFWAIKAEPYIEHLYDCSNKSSKYARILREAGYDANIIVTSVKEGHHAIVFIRFANGDHLYCDPTQGKWSAEIDAFGTPKHIIPFEERFDEKWAHEFVEVF